MNNMAKNWKSILIYLLIPVLLIGAIIFFSQQQTKVDVKYSDIVTVFKNDEVKEFTLDLSSGSLIYKTFAEPDKEQRYSVPNVAYFLDDIRDEVEEYNEKNPDNKIVFDYKKGTSGSWIYSMLPSLVITIGIIALSIYMIRKMSSAMNNETNRTLGFGKIRAKVHTDDEKNKTTFADVAGCDEEKEEMQELVDFLKDSEKFTALGARIPKGVLMVGPPGTGKTLLARAVAGEADTPFLSISGSDFVEMYVGVGASRVRDLFDQAQKKAPCIVFIDEIDAVGRHRGTGTGGGNDEREQTLNQILVEMDGFGNNTGIIVIAATNRPDVLDPALLRPGRFDRQVVVGLPDIRGREQILKVHMRKVPMRDDVAPGVIARGTPGFSGADLANLVNEAALRAVRKGRRLVTQEDLLASFEFVIAGSEKKNSVLTEFERKLVAYHEVGHALVSALQKHSEPVQKITIVPRTMGALGYVMNVPEEEKYLNTKKELQARLVELMAGRAAEEIVFETVTTGAANDIQQATNLARAMVTQYGMSEKFGLMGLESQENQYLTGRNVLNCGDATAAEIDKEVMKILKDSYHEAISLLSDNKDAMDQIAAFLIEKETITGKEFMQIFRKVKGIPEPEEKAEDKAEEKPGAKPEDTAANQPGYRAEENTGARPEDMEEKSAGGRQAAGNASDSNTSGRYTASDDTRETHWNHPGDGFRS